MTEHTAFIGLGSNLGDREGHLAAARRILAEATTITTASSLYETEPVDFPNQPWFLNQVVRILSPMSAFELLGTCLGIERHLGRTRQQPKGPRVIDLDLLLYDDLVLDEEHEGYRLTLPHPRLHLRRFVLTPLCELAPALVHPQIDRTLRELLTDLGDKAEVKRYDPAHQSA